MYKVLIVSMWISLRAADTVPGLTSLTTFTMMMPGKTPQGHWTQLLLLHLRKPLQVQLQLLQCPQPLLQLTLVLKQA